MTEPCTAEVLAPQPIQVLVRGTAYTWTPEGGLDPNAVLEIRHYIRREAGKLKNTAAVQGIGIEDLVQEGLAAAVMAARRFDPSFGANFLTYAAFWVRQHLLRAMRENHVKIGERNREALRRQGTLPSIFSIDVEIIRGGGTRAELLPGDTPNPHQEAELTAQSLALHQALAQLKPRYREVLKRRFGLGCAVHTQAQIAALWGVSRQRVFEIEHLAMARLRRIMERNQP